MTKTQTDARTFVFTADNVRPGESVTIAPGWQKGIVSHHAYYIDLFFIYWGIFSALLLILLSIIFSILHWYFLEKVPMEKLVIIPQYEPPQNLSPAMAEIIVKENISKSAWPATIVDLACRGYLTIEEDEEADAKGSNKRKIFTIIAVIFIATDIVSFFFLDGSNRRCISGWATNP